MTSARWQIKEVLRRLTHRNVPGRGWREGVIDDLSPDSAKMWMLLSDVGARVDLGEDDFI